MLKIHLKKRHRVDVLPFTVDREVSKGKDVTLIITEQNEL
jgi:hypothetical protein